MRKNLIIFWQNYFFGLYDPPCFFSRGKESGPSPYEPKSYRIYIGANENSIYCVTRSSSAYDSRDEQKFAVLSSALREFAAKRAPRAEGKKREMVSTRFSSEGVGCQNRAQTGARAFATRGPLT